MNCIKPAFQSKARGVSLIELMIAIAIGSLLLLGLVQVFSASRAAYNTSEGMARVQESGRFAIDYLQRDLRMAGHFGCANDQAHEVRGRAEDVVNHFGPTPPDALNFDLSIVGYEATGTAPGDDLEVGDGAATWTPGLPAAISALNPSGGSDIVALRYFVGSGVPVTGLAPVSGGPQTDVQFPAGRDEALTGGGVAAPSIFAVSDCSQVDVFGGELIGNLVRSDDADITAKYGASPSIPTMLYRAESIVYYVAPGASGLPSLWRARADELGNFPPGGREELIEGVESLQFLFGRDSTADISSQTPPTGNITMQDTAATISADAASTSQQAEWLRVGLVQVGVLVSSPNRAGVDEPASEDLQPRVLGVRFSPPSSADARYRGSYEVTVAVRNRLFGN